MPPVYGPTDYDKDIQHIALNVYCTNITYTYNLDIVTTL